MYIRTIRFPIFGDVGTRCKFLTEKSVGVGQSGISHALKELAGPALSTIICTLKNRWVALSLLFLVHLCLDHLCVV